MKTTVWVIEDVLKDQLGIAQDQARHVALEICEQMSRAGFNIVAGPPPGWRLQLVELDL